MHTQNRIDFIKHTQKHAANAALNSHPFRLLLAMLLISMQPALLLAQTDPVPLEESTILQAAEVEVERQRPDQFIGLQLFTRSSLYKGGSLHTTAFPLLRLNKGPLFASDRVGFGSFIGVIDNWYFGLSLGPGYGDMERNDIDELSDLDELRMGLTANFITVVDFEKNTYALNIGREVGGASGGYGVDFLFFHSIQLDRLNVIPSLALHWRSQDAIDYAYGVEAKNVRPGRPLYQPQSGIHGGFAIDWVYKLTSNWSLHWGVDYLRMSSQVRNSPLVGRRTLRSGYFGLAYHFR